MSGLCSLVLAAMMMCSTLMPVLVQLETCNILRVEPSSRQHLMLSSCRLPHRQRWTM